MRFPRITIFVLIASFLLEPLAPAIVQAAPDKAGDKWANEGDLNFDSLPPFPEDAQAPVIDWATVDWDTPITLPTDSNEYRQKLAELEKAGRWDEMGKLKPRQSLMSDQDVLAHYGAPQAVQELVLGYLAIKPNIKTEAMRVYARYYLAQNIRGELESADYYPADFERQPIKYQEEAEEELPKIDLRTIKTSTFRETRPLKYEKIKIRLPAGLNPVKAGLEVFRQPVKRVVKPKQVSFLPWLRSLFIDEALAYYQPTVPLITYFAGIEKQPIPNLLYQLAQTQNEDGSWGDYNRYQNTAEITLVLSGMRLIDNDQYALAIAYLTNAPAQNNREIAIKARLYADLSLPNQSLAALSAMEYNSDGGFGLRPGEGSDVETTLEILAAYGHATLTMPESAVAYVLSKIEANGQMRYATDTPASYHLMNQTARMLYPQQLIVSELARQFSLDTDLSSFDEVDVLQTLRTLTLYNNHQPERDQLWAEALARSRANSYSGADLSVIVSALNALPQPDLAIISLRTLGSTVNGEAVSLELTVKNKGYARASGATLAVFANDYQIQDAIIFSPSQLTLDPNGQKTVVVDFPAALAKRFLGDTELKFYLENSGDSSYANNWLAASYNFTSAPDASPSLPLYYVAIKTVDDNQASINMTWPPRPDANRVTNMFLYRKQGSPAWTASAIPELNNFNIAGFDEDTVYEVTAGVLGNDGVINYFPDTTLITTSSDATKYAGSFSGQVTVDNQPAPHFDVSACGVSTTHEAGNFSCADAPHGVRTPFAGIDRPTYPYERLRVPVKVRIGETTAGVRLYTRLRPDTAAPVITSVELRGATDGTVLYNQTVQLVAGGIDNISPAETDFYYYDPVQAVWLYISTDSTNESSGSSFAWTIPAITPGPNYRVGARMRDAADNESDFREWGPFVISDGIDYDAPVVKDLQIFGEMDMSFNNQRTVTVYASGTDNMGIVGGTLEYWEPSQSQWLSLVTVNSASASIYYQWPVSASIQGSGYKLRVKLRDAASNESGWTEWGPFTVVNGTKPSGTIRVEGLVNNQWLLGETKNITWSLTGANPINSIPTARIYFSPTFSNYIGDINPTLISSKSYSVPLNASFAASGAYVEFQVCDVVYNCAYIKSNPFAVVDSSPPPPAPWQMPAPIQLVSNSPGVERFRPRVYRRSDGVTAVIYQETEGIATSDPGQYRRIVYRALINDVWQAPVKVVEYLYRSGVTADISYNNARGFYDSTGALHIAYSKNIYTGSEGNPDSWRYDNNARQIEYARIYPAGTLADQRLVSSGVISAVSAQVAFTGDNHAVVIYNGGYNSITDSGPQLLYYSEDLGNGNWSAPAPLSADSVGGFSVTNDNGALVVVYSQWPGVLKFIRRPSAGSWGAPVAILSDNSSQYDLALFAKGSSVYDIFYRLYNSDVRKYSVNYLKFNLNANGLSTNILQQRQVTSLINNGSVQAFMPLASAHGYHIIYTHRPGDFVRAEYVFFNDRGTYLSTVISPQLLDIDGYTLDGYTQNDVVGVYFSGLFNTANLSSAIANLSSSPPIAPPSPGATPAANTAIQLSNYGPGNNAAQSIKFASAATAPAPGSLTINWPAGFSLNSVAPNTDITVTGGGVTWAPVLNNNLNALARTLTLNWTSGSLTPGSAVSIDVNSVKNPASAGQFNISVASGEDIQVLPVNIDSGLVSVTAFVPYPFSNPTVSNITPVQTIIIQSGQTQIITFSLGDVNNDSVTYTLTPSSGALSVNPNPPSPLSNTQDGRTVSFTYLANGATGPQTITVTADDNEPTGGGVVTYQIQLFII